MIVNGCSISPSNETKKHVTILYKSIPDFERDFDGLKQHFNNIEIEVVEYESVLGKGMWDNFELVPQSGDDWNADAFINLIKKDKPDIIFFPRLLFSRLREEGILYDISSFSYEPEIQRIDPLILDTVREMGDGKLYAISNLIATQALYYNKQLFQKYEMTEPVSLMNWEDVLKLGNSISKIGSSDGIVGLQTANYDNVELFLQIGKSKGLTWYDPIHQRALFASEEWKSALALIVDKYKSEVNSDKELGSFEDGHIAMAIDTYRLKDNIKQSNPDLDWNLVTAPVTHYDPNKSTAITFDYLNGINQEAKDISSAKEVWLYLNSRTMAQKRFYTSYFRFTVPVFEGIVKDDQKNVQAFYQVKPEISKDTSLPNKAMVEVKRYLDQDIKKIVSGDLSIDETVKSWDTEIPNIILKYQE
ncbi:ABC transporter substrate-binding protein [Paenibacillus sp. 3LSP]|uniref:ABC transporter substrate-binding protein n=1 Tax=Paenibacillus sp. 3LSP TaxID=2800795 RepID=UPI002905D56D|nr:extracellular solute-binding protein [Paenibacillus sp. 3LSP]